MVQTLMDSQQKRAFAGKALAVSLVCWGLFTVVLSFPAIIFLSGNSPLYRRWISVICIILRRRRRLLVCGAGNVRGQRHDQLPGLFTEALFLLPMPCRVPSSARFFPDAATSWALSAGGFRGHGSVHGHLRLRLQRSGFPEAIVIVVRMIYDKYEKPPHLRGGQTFHPPDHLRTAPECSAASLYLSGILEIASGGLTMTILSIITLIVIALVFALEQKKDRAPALEDPAVSGHIIRGMQCVCGECKSITIKRPESIP